MQQQILEILRQRIMSKMKESLESQRAAPVKKEDSIKVKSAADGSSLAVNEDEDLKDYAEIQALK